MQTLDFVGTISHQGEQRVVVIPKRYHKDITDALKNGKIAAKQLKITIKEV